MATRNSVRARKYIALTILKRGRLSKSHLADPKVGLDLESKKNQDEPILVTLTPLAKIPVSTMLDSKTKVVKDCELDL